jgi:hypothetical protein
MKSGMEILRTDDLVLPSPTISWSFTSLTVSSTVTVLRRKSMALTLSPALETAAGSNASLTMGDRGDRAMRECALELLERTERTLAAIDAGEAHATKEDTWMLQGFRMALQWVLSFE